MKSHGNSILASHEFSEMNDKPDQSISHGPMIRITQEFPIMSLQRPVARRAPRRRRRWQRPRANHGWVGLVLWGQSETQLISPTDHGRLTRLA